MYNDCGCFEGKCPANIFEEARISVPAAVRGYADVDNVEINCFGPPSITRCPCEARGAADAASMFTVSQNVRVKIPIMFGAKAEVGEANVDYNPCDCDCKRGFRY